MNEMKRISVQIREIKRVLRSFMIKLQSRDAKEKVSLEWRLVGGTSTRSLEGEPGMASGASLEGEPGMASGASLEDEPGMASGGAEHRPPVLRCLRHHNHHLHPRDIAQVYPVLRRRGPVPSHRGVAAASRYRKS